MNEALQTFEKKPIFEKVQVLIAGGEVIEARALNISILGMEMVLPRALAPGCKLTIRLPLPGTRRDIRFIVAASKVSYAVMSGAFGGHLVGLEFAKLTASSLARIDEFVARYNHFAASSYSTSSAFL